MTSEELSNNPRLSSRANVGEKLLADLTTSEELFQSTNSARESKVFPDLAVVYGLMARVYMWDENYPKQQPNMPAKAISTGTGYAPLTPKRMF
ncbi:hypothetical protein E7747_16345 (plasmid) [Duncaniella dubosii]|uniref:Uncharacterized protein n=1 Tax=Duncaniella dubosii TaxID=2518971 RepID=A0A4P7W6T3_9BACT|nr:hypothetical protein E7747_16345 [Duncaniella dubosii]